MFSHVTIDIRDLSRAFVFYDAGAYVRDLQGNKLHFVTRGPL